MRNLRFPALAMVAIVFALIASLSTASAGDRVADKIEVSDVWARAMPPMQPTSAMFLTLKNTASTAHALVSASSDVARTVELHTHLMEDGVARMRQVGKIDIPANGEASLAPGGYHVMLIGLHAPLKEGEVLSATLTFEDGSTKTVEAAIRGLSYKGDGASHGGMKCGAGKCGMSSDGGMKCGGGKCGTSSDGGMKCGGGKCGGGKCGGR
ncbi:MAG: copper chaperone PCu(A)C [Chromatiales bacterium]|nr:copper chaperone PCu(A)C [Gammaproteobacteria bacterium]MCP5351590.1 copper chaperone PCu(A)C [Chromatiales bacterium]